MTGIAVSIVDVYVIRPTSPWQVLVLQRAEGTRCPGAWEAVHGRIEPGERPEEAAVRELREETGLAPARLYNVTCSAFYLHATGSVQVTVVFCAFVDPGTEVTLGVEHRAHEWLTPEEASARFAWPRERDALRDIAHLLRAGHAGPVEDVLRVL